MKLLHLGDLHFGKRVGNLSLLKDQKDLNEIIYDTIDREGIDAVLICGDIYDKGIPAEEAVKVFDDFLVELAKKKIPVMITAGNHDSAERLSFGDRLIETADIYISPAYDGNVKKVSLKDEYGTVNFYLLPFVKPVDVRHAFGNETIENYTDALRVAIGNMNVDTSERNVILSHQFVTDICGTQTKTDGSEDELYVGGTAAVHPSVYEPFDYTALGHIHRPQHVWRDNIRYCGSLMKFSFNEEEQNKKLTIVELGEKGNIKIDRIPITPPRDFITVKGTFSEMRKNKDGIGKDDFVRVILTDENDIANAFSILRETYPCLQELRYDNKRTNNMTIADGGETAPDLKPIEMAELFYKQRNNSEMSEEQREIVSSLIEEIWGGK